MFILKHVGTIVECICGLGTDEMETNERGQNHVFGTDVGILATRTLLIDRVQNGPPWGLGTTVPQIWTPKSAGTPEV